MDRLQHSLLLFMSLLVCLATLLLGAGQGRLAEPSPPSPEPSPLLSLNSPLGCDGKYTISQGNHGRTHHGWGQYAWDFSAPVGTLVYAPTDGTITRVRDDSTRFGCDPSFGWDANYIVLSVDDGIDVLLLHLDAESALVEVGDVVTTGQPLARVGNSGWVCGTHLHLQVQQTCHTWWCPSLPATFLDGQNPDRGELIANQSCLAPDRYPETHTSLWKQLRAMILPDSR